MYIYICVYMYMYICKCKLANVELVVMNFQSKLMLHTAPVCFLLRYDLTKSTWAQPLEGASTKWQYFSSFIILFSNSRLCRAQRIGHSFLRQGPEFPPSLKPTSQSQPATQPVKICKQLSYLHVCWCHTGSATTCISLLSIELHFKRPFRVRFRLGTV